MDRQAGPLPIRKQRFSDSICSRNAEGFCHTKTSIMRQSHISRTNSCAGRTEILEVKNSAPSPEELHQAFEHRSQPPGAGIYVTCHFSPPTSVYFKAVAGVRYVLKWEQYEHFLAAVYNNSILRWTYMKKQQQNKGKPQLTSEGLFRMTLLGRESREEKQMKT